MKRLTLAVAVAAGVMFGGAAEGYSPPEVIGEFWASAENFIYAQDYACIGDQNGDGRDDLLFSGGLHQRWEIYFGADRMETGAYNADIPFRQGDLVGASGVAYLGDMSENRRNTFIIQSYTRIAGAYTTYLDFVTGVEPGEREVWQTWVSRGLAADPGWFRIRKLNRLSSCFDFNNDGWMDLTYLHSINDSIGAVEVSFGRDDFDTTWSWRKCFRQERGSITGSEYQCGGDVNGDGYADLLIWASWPPATYQLYLGGENPDTTAVLEFREDDYWTEEFRIVMNSGFAVLRDVNDDGYDDIGVYAYRSRRDRYDPSNKVYVFFGSEQPDAEVDLILDGSIECLDMGVRRNSVLGGDFNGDGIGDIAAGYFEGPPSSGGEVHFHLGNRWIDGRSDIVVTDRDYGGYYREIGASIGGIGDYNGDGADDLAAQCVTDSIMLVILAGNRGWRVDAPGEEAPVKHSLTVAAFPNPFNSRLTVDFSLPPNVAATLRLFDVAGRTTRSEVVEGSAEGNERFTFDGLEAGIYFASLETPQGRVVRKAVCVK